MSGPDWHKRYHRKALKGMAKLTVDLRGVYQTLQDMIYDEGGPIDDDEKYLAGQMMLSIRAYRSLRDKLLALGRISKNESGQLVDDRCTTVLADLERVRDAQVEGGRAGGQKRAENSVKNSGKNRETLPKTFRKSPENEAAKNENNDLAQGDLGFSERDTRARLLDSKIRRESSLLCVDEGWPLDAAALEAGMAAGLSRSDIETEAARHRRYWRAKNVRRTADEWRFSWDERVREVAAKRGRPIEAATTRPAIIEPPALPTEGPAWWIECARKIANAFPEAWATRFAFVTPTNEAGVVSAATCFIAQEINSGQAGAQARRSTGIEIRAIDPRDAQRALA
jgi:hypothetical protein